MKPTNHLNEVVDGRGNHGHAGRPGQKGGSAPSGSDRNSSEKRYNPRLKGVETRKTDAYSKRFGQDFGNRPLDAAVTEEIFNKLNVGDKIVAQKSYRDGTPMGPLIQARVKVAGREGQYKWLEVEGKDAYERIYSHEYFTKIHFWKNLTYYKK